MKKFSLLSLCLTVGIAMSAQTKVVDEVKHMLGQSKPNYEEAFKAIQPALSDPSTMNSAMPWYLAGKAAIGIYDSYYLQSTLGNELNADQKSKAGKAMIDAYNNYFVAIPLDVEVDKKTGEAKLDKNGTPKPGKQVKEMQKALKENYNQLKTAGIYLYEAQDYDGAYDAWQIYVELPTNPILGEEKPVADADTLVGQIMYYQLLCALINNHDEKALAKFKEIEKTNYNNIDAYVYGLNAATRLDDKQMMSEIAKKGYELYGTENTDFIGQLINERLDAEDYPACESLIKKAIDASSDPQIKGQLLNMLGVVYERQDKTDKALEEYNEAIAVDPESARNYFNAGRIYYNRAVLMDTDEYNVSPEVKENLLKATELFEKAFGLDEDNMQDAVSLLVLAYYRLGAGYEEQQKYWESLK